MEETVRNTVMLIKFSKQIANSLAKIINGFKDEFKTLSTSEMELFPQNRYWFQRQTQNVAKHLRWNFLQKQSKTKKVLNMLLNWFPKFKVH